jgi:hypothetical protein
MIRLALAALLMGLVACGGGDDPDIIIFDAPVLCDPRTQSGCATGEKCATRRLTATLSEVTCLPDGTVEVGGTCKTGEFGEQGFSDCKAGGECVNDICKQVCDHQIRNSQCPDTHACGTYQNLLERNDMTVAGVCDPKCDPLTQSVLTGSVTAACGSPNAQGAAATVGCFSADLFDWTCAVIPMDARTLTDRQPARPFLNGCAAGYMIMLNEGNGSMSAICSGICAPGKSDSVNPANAKGDPAIVAKLHNAAAPAAGDGVCTIDKKGSSDDGNQQNCHYMWFWNFDPDTGMFFESPYNNTTGICFTYTRYKYNHDNNPMTEPIQFPKCEELPPAGQPPHPMHGNANAWGCVPDTEAMLTSGKKKRMNPLAQDVRLGFRPGVAVRHVLRQE